MTQKRTDRPVRILAIGLDRLTAKAVRSDFPRATVTATRTLTEDGRHGRDATPDLVVMGGAQPCAAEQRAAIWQRWGDAVVVVEIHAQQPLARVWRTPTLMERVDLGPGFLSAFLPRVVVLPERSAPQLTALRMVGYLAILWNLTVGVYLMHLSPSGVALTMFGFAVLVMDRVYRSWHERQDGSNREPVR